MNEVDEIRQRYARRERHPTTAIASDHFFYQHYLRFERELKYAEILRHRHVELANARILEIGAGEGDNLLFFHRLGIPWANIWANELLEDRGDILRANLPNSQVIIGNALGLPAEPKFDIVFQSTVFTSILDPGFKQQLARKMMALTKPDGLILWYDFSWDNPRNPDVKGVSKAEIKHLFSEASSFRFHRVTLAPPIGRRIGRFYNLVNCLFPMLKTHLVVEISR